MGFFGMGFWEIMVILLIILLVVGPNRLPEITRKMGQTLRAIRKASNEITSGLTRDLKVEEFESDPLEQSEKSKQIEK